MYPTLRGQDNFLGLKESIQVSGNLNQELTSTVNFTNTTDKVLQLMVKRMESSIGTSQSTWFCIKEECYDKTTERTPLSIRLEPGETFSGFQSRLSSGLAEGFSSVKYVAYDKNDPTKKVEFEVNYLVEDLSNTNFIFQSDQIELNDVYPNPVTDYAIIDYKVYDPELNSRIVIHSVLGSIMNEYTLQPLETNLRIRTDTYNPGVYFYTLYIDNDAVMTRKLIIHN